MLSGDLASRFRLKDDGHACSQQGIPRQGSQQGQNGLTLLIRAPELPKHPKEANTRIERVQIAKVPESELAGLQRGLVEGILIYDSSPIASASCTVASNIKQPPQLRQHHRPRRMRAAPAELEAKL